MKLSILKAFCMTTTKRHGCAKFWRNTERTREAASTKQQQCTPSVPLPYVQGVKEKISCAFHKQGINTYHVLFNTLRSQLGHPKDPTTDGKKCGVIYKLECADCKKVYIGETSRPFNVRLKEHSNTTRSTLSAVGEHLRETCHNVEERKAAVIAREENNFRRRICEALEILRQSPTLN